MNRRLIRTFADGSSLEFGPGQFDDWCVFQTPPGGQPRPPLDREYFAALRSLAARQGPNKLYDDFIAVFDRTTTQVEDAVLADIAARAGSYRLDAPEVELVLTILYAGMIAEENKANAVLKKRLKRLGLHQVLIEGWMPDRAAGFSKGKPWTELDAECRRRGF